MFGFLNPRPHSFAYRRVYARVCQHQRRWYGVASLAFHSYEAVFAYQLALDAGAVPDRVLPNRRCCRLAPPRDLALDERVGRYAASVGVLLAGVKLDDDIRDQHSLAARLAKGVLGGAIRRANAHLAALDPKFPQAVAYHIADHHRLEQATEPATLWEYVRPTAEAFATTFRLLGRLPSLPAHADLFANVGRHVGAAIIAYDAAVDREQDRRRGEYNPLPDVEAASDALTFAADELRQAADRCRKAFGSACGSAATLLAVARRVVRTDPQVCPTARRTNWNRTLVGLATATFAPASRAVYASHDPELPDEVPSTDDLPPETRQPAHGTTEVAADAASRSFGCGNGCGNDCGWTGCDCCGDVACDAICNSCDCNCN